MVTQLILYYFTSLFARFDSLGIRRNHAYRAGIHTHKNESKKPPTNAGGHTTQYIVLEHKSDTNITTKVM